MHAYIHIRMHTCKHAYIPTNNDITGDLKLRKLPRHYHPQVSLVIPWYTFTAATILANDRRLVGAGTCVRPPGVTNGVGKRIHTCPFFGGPVVRQPTSTDQSINIVLSPFQIAG